MSFWDLALIISPHLFEDQAEELCFCTLNFESPNFISYFFPSIKVKINLVRSLMFLDLNVNAKLPPTVGWIIRIYKRYRYLIFFANDQFAIWSKFTAPKDLYYSLCTIDTLASNRPLYVMNVIFVSFVMLALNSRLYWWICTKSYFFECMVWSPTAYHFLYRYLLDFKY